MAITFIGSSTKLSSVLSPSLQLSSIKTTLSSLFSSISKPASSGIDLSSLTGSLPNIMTLLGSLTSSSAKPTINADTLNTLMQTLQPLLQSIGGGSSVSQSQLLQTLPTVVKSITALISSFSGQSNVSESVTKAITALKPLLDILANAGSGSDTSQLISTLNKVLDIAQPILQMAGSANSGNIDLSTVAQGAAEALMPLLASINTGNSSIDMAMLQKALPAVIGSVTSLVSSLSKANEGNIPETISGVLKGINPLLKLLAESGSLDASQTETVNAVYNVLNSVKTILDFANNPSLLTLSTDLNNVLDSLKPVIAMLDQKGDISSLLDGAHIPDLGELLGGLIKPAAEQPQEGSTSAAAPAPNLSDLLSGTSALGNIDLSAIAPQLGEAANKISGLLSGGAPDLSALLPNLIQPLDINPHTPYV